VPLPTTRNHELVRRPEHEVDARTRTASCLRTTRTYLRLEPLLQAFV
jgi:hypothetical protein